MQPAGRDMPPGMLGCYLSHIAVYRLMQDAAAPVALVLEDDARLDPRFVPTLREGLRSLDFDYCLLDCHPANPQGHVYYDRADGVNIGPGLTAYATHAPPTGSHAYLITREAAAQRALHAFPIRRVLDVYSELPYRPRFRVLVSPPGAGVSRDSHHSLTEERDHRTGGAMALLRAVPGYYPLRNLLDPRLWRLQREVPRLVRRGVLPPHGDWRPLPPGRRIRG